MQLKNTNDLNYEKPTVLYEINTFLFQLILRLSMLFEQQVLCSVLLVVIDFRHSCIKHTEPLGSLALQLPSHRLDFYILQAVLIHIFFFLCVMASYILVYLLIAYHYLQKVTVPITYSHQHADLIRL